MILTNPNLQPCVDVKKFTTINYTSPMLHIVAVNFAKTNFIHCCNYNASTEQINCSANKIIML